jgi:hypothetical protein
MNIDGGRLWSLWAKVGAVGNGAALSTASRPVHEAHRPQIHGLRRGRVEHHGTLARLFETYVGHLKSQGRRSHADAANIFRNHVAEAWPKIAEKPGAEVKADEVPDILRRLVERGHGRTANKLRAYLRAACQCAIDARAVASLPIAFRAFQIETNPVANTKRDPAFDTADKRPMSAEDLRAYWEFIKRIDGPRGSFLRLHLLTARCDRRRDHDLRRQGSAWAPRPRASGAAAGQGRGDTARIPAHRRVRDLHLERPATDRALDREQLGARDCGRSDARLPTQASALGRRDLAGLARREP